MAQCYKDNAEGFNLWGGRFTKTSAKSLQQLNCSLHVDKRLYAEDINGSVGYASALEEAGIISAKEKTQITSGLKQILKEWQSNEIVLLSEEEDVHSVNERRLKEIIGVDVGGKLHTGRSRNDQVATDMRMWLRKALPQIRQCLQVLIQTMNDRAKDNIDVIMPGYTHLQRAQPIRWSHWLLSHAWSLISDYTRFVDLSGRTNVMPLGSGALAGNPFDIDRLKLAKELNFNFVSENSMHSVSDRDFVAEFLFDCSLCGVHLSRLAEDLILYCTREFGFVSIDDSYSTGSSLMPQKRNPDSMELVRGMVGLLFGECAGFMMSLKGLPSTYNKDLQNDKKCMFSSFDNLKDVLEVITGVIKTLKVNTERCFSSLSYEMLATDVAYYLVRKGVPFRDAHRLAGEAVVLSEQVGVPLHQLPVDKLRNISEHFDERLVDVWNFENSVEQYSVIGGTAKSSVNQQIIKLDFWLKQHTE